MEARRRHEGVDSEREGRVLGLFGQFGPLNAYLKVPSYLMADQFARWRVREEGGCATRTGALLDSAVQGARGKGVRGVCV